MLTATCSKTSWRRYKIGTPWQRKPPLPGRMRKRSSSAEQGKQLPRWSAVLQLANEIVADERVAALIGNPRVSATQLAELIIAVAGAEFDGNAQNFVRLLVENDRLSVLPEIAELYEHYRAEAERAGGARMGSAFPVDDAQKAQVAAMLKKRLGREVTVSADVDPSLVGGAIIRAGDLVIDGTVLGQLAKLEVALAR